MSVGADEQHSVFIYDLVSHKMQGSFKAGGSPYYLAVSSPKFGSLYALGGKRGVMLFTFTNGKFDKK